MTVFVTGGSGFVGTYIVQELRARGHDARCLVHSQRTNSDFDTVQGDILDPASLKGTMDGCDSVIHLVGIIDEGPSKGITFKRIYEDGTRNVVGAAKAAGLENFVYMSANGARPDGVSAYQTGKWAAEELVRSAGFQSATIFRPSTVFGRPAPGQPEFCSRLLRQLVAPFPILPIFGDGLYQMQPVAVESVAKGFATAATQPVAGVREYGVSGPDKLPYVQIIDIITQASGRQTKPKINVPIPLARLGIEALGWTGLLPISIDQFEMLIEGNTCPNEAFNQAFDIDPVPFSVQALSYLQQD